MQPEHSDKIVCSTEPRHTEAVSLKKLLKGDGSWFTRKEILGWIIDTIRQTLELPSHRKQELVELLSGLQSKKRVAFQEWQKVLGKLRFIAKAIPGSRGLFCGLQEASSCSHTRPQATPCHVCRPRRRLMQPANLPRQNRA